MGGTEDTILPWIKDLKTTMILLHLITVLHFLLTLFRPLSYKLFDIIGRIILGKRKRLPPIRSKLLLMSATELAERIRKRKVTAEEVMRAYINRVKEVDPILNACVDKRFEEAIADAVAVDKMLKAGKMTEEQLEAEVPLLGVPFSCKEMIGVKGFSQTNGLLHFKDRKSPSDAAAVLQYKRAGAIPYVVTNVPTISMWWETSNLVFGRTFNPYDHRRTVGGSSGGEGAILSSAGAVIGIGTDIGGSIRIPCAFCGVYGHKPSRGIISTEKPWPLVNKKFDFLRSTGPMCRYVQDLVLLVRILSGGDGPKLQLDKKVDFSKVRIYYMEEMPGFLLSATRDVKAAVRKAVKHFEENFGNIPTKLSLEEMRYAFDIWQSKFVEADGPPLRTGLQQKDKKTNGYWELLKCIFHRAQLDFPILFFAAIERGDKDKHYYKCLKMFEKLRKKLEDVLAGDAVLLMPTHPEPAPHLTTTIPKVKNIGYTCIFNVLGYPVTHIPAGLSYGVPIGLQAVSSHLKDNLTLAAAVELDKVFNGWKCPSEIEL